MENILNKIKKFIKLMFAPRCKCGNKKDKK